ncbi:methyl-accepting chemotaxis protein [Paenibacillus sp. PK3_47]|uniref:methyl-accepting chemotaxis protein n=1 Tax=Paenibacillus sp. PK3_47 TaxID=2072642 RepID=UPI00201DF53D|nr:methyl-accepting chemotaxis protein [Paenibacillus sp. PK3_47]UQZ35001.1 methyl-accepting chemotaxis protein [Paenibacillus sp. PK3_47]
MRHLKVKYKVALLAAIAVILIIGLGAVSITTIGTMADRSQETYSGNLQPVYLVTEIRANNRTIESYLLEQMVNKDSARNGELTAGIEENIERNNGLMEQLKSVRFSSSEIENLINEYISLLSDYRTQRNNIIQLAANNLNAEAYQVFSGSTFSALRDKMTALLDDATGLLVQDAGERNELTAESAKNSTNVSTALITAAWVLCIAISIMITRLITKPLKELQGTMQRAEQGDLTVKASYNSRDEIGQINQSFNLMLDSLKGMMQGVSESAEMLSASSQEMSASAEQTSLASRMIAETAGGIASGFEAQVDSIARTSQSAQTMAGDIAAVERSGNEMSELMSRAALSADLGAEAVGKIMDQMKEIDTSVTASQAIVSHLDNLSEEINTIITTINEISAQTNLLSLNASIEAARAGEYGRGFAVVAGEIRKLAEATGRSSLQITDIIADIQQQTGSAVKSMALGVELVSHGVAQSELVSQAFAEIDDSIRSAVEQTEEMRAAIGHVLEESKAVSEAMEQANGVTRKGAGDIQETSAASEEQLAAMGEMSMSAQYLATLAEDLQKELAKFRL